MSSGRLCAMDDIDRRTLLRLGGIGALGVAAGSALGACSSSTSRRGAPARATTSTTFRSPAIDPAKPWWLQGNFAPVTSEIETVDLPVSGSLPRELSGLYVRN